MQFLTLRDVLELLQDFPILGDILSLATKSGNANILSSVADTLNFHHDIFATLDITRSCFDALLKRYHSLKAQKTTDPKLIRSLVELASRISNVQDTARYLRLDLYDQEHPSAVAAYSPVSDDMPGVANLTDAEFHDDVDRLLSSGTSIDSQTLTSLFHKIVTRVENSCSQPSGKSMSFGDLLVKLRALDTRNFDKLMSDWTCGALQTQCSPRLFQELSSMVLKGAISFHTIVSSSAKILDAVPEQQVDITEAALAIGIFNSLGPEYNPERHVLSEVG